MAPQEKEIKKIVATNLNKLLSHSDARKSEISKAVSIPPSTLTGYFKGTRLPTPENVTKLANFFHVSEEEIDPRFEPILGASVESTAPADNKIVDLQADDPDRDAKAAEKEIIKLSAETTRWFIKYWASDADLQELEELIEQRKNK